jgi:hypothetical protein
MPRMRVDGSRAMADVPNTAEVLDNRGIRSLDSPHRNATLPLDSASRMNLVGRRALTERFLRRGLDYVSVRISARTLSGSGSSPLP